MIDVMWSTFLRMYQPVALSVTAVSPWVEPVDAAGDPVSLLVVVWMQFEDRKQHPGAMSRHRGRRIKLGKDWSDQPLPDRVREFLDRSPLLGGEFVVCLQSVHRLLQLGRRDPLGLLSESASGDLNFVIGVALILHPITQHGGTLAGEPESPAPNMCVGHPMPPWKVCRYHGGPW